MKTGPQGVGYYANDIYTKRCIGRAKARAEAQRHCTWTSGRLAWTSASWKPRWYGGDVTVRLCELQIP